MANGTAYTQMVQRCVKWLSVMQNGSVKWLGEMSHGTAYTRLCRTSDALAEHSIAQHYIKFLDVVANCRACLWRDVKTISPKPPKIQTANRTASAGRHDVIESEHYRETITWCCGCSFYHSLHALVSLNMFIVLSRVMT